MAAPKIRKSTDTDAPVLNGVYGSAIPLFRAVCVNGYGTQESLGWTEEFSKSGVIVIRPGVSSVGNRRYYRIEDDSSVTYSSGHSKFRISTYETMSDVDTGTGLVAEKHYYKSNVSNIDSMPWTIIGDASGFYIIVNCYQDSYSVYAEVNYVGHGIPLFDDDAWFSMITGYSSTSTNVLSAFPFINNPGTSSFSDSIYLSRKLSGDASTIGAASFLKYNGGIGNNATNMVSGSSSNFPSEFNYPYKGKLMLSTPIVADASQYGVRGFIPGFKVPQHGSGFTDREVITHDGVSYLPIRVASGSITAGTSYGWVLVDISSDFR